jgi:hypothetical protein
MSRQDRAGLEAAPRIRADVRQALLKSGFAHLYPGIPTGEWQPATVMAQLVLGLGSASIQRTSLLRDRVLDEKHFQFRGLPSAGSRDDQRRSRLEDRRKREAEA